MLEIPKATLYAPTLGVRPQINLKRLPYIRVELPSEAHALQLNKRAILIKDVIDEIG